MPHAESSLVPENITSKSHFWAHVFTQLDSLLDQQRNWVSNLANAASLIFNSLLGALLAFPAFFGKDNKAVNWCGFYIDSNLFPSRQAVSQVDRVSTHSSQLLLGPFCGKPACQFINVAPNKARGVCADAFLQRRTLIVPQVHEYPGHIACDPETKSEIVCPLISRVGENEVVLGILDLDCLAVAGFDEEDKSGLEKIAALVVRACDW